ncbi:hypothetical protein DFH27DRAFT_585122 [Peziza echinospora]|nr:hypothetical protein DFH27DRAFT_585122 [Peziza echinospora]
MQFSSSLVFSLLALAAAALALPGSSHPEEKAELVQSNKLRRALTRSSLLKHAAKLQEFANADPDGNRAFGGVGHKLTVDYLYDTFASAPLNKYYTVQKQEFVHEYAYGTSEVVAEGKAMESVYFTYSPAANLTAEAAAVGALGCVESDYPAEVKGRIALVSRGECQFGLKSVLAGKAGATGIIIYNNAPGTISGGTFGAPVRPEGPYVPGAMITQEDGQALLADVAAGPVLVELVVDSVLENRTTHNVIAQTIAGDQNNVVATGGHTDSVGNGPGINDDGSGTIGILETAIQLAKFRVNNAVRFCFWSAEEFGLVGSEHYVANLPVAEQNKVALYLNFDMIASPNYVYFIYDGDGSAFNTTGPAGSAQIEHLFEDYFDSVGEPTAPTAFDGRSDYGPFLDVGIPAGGLFTGAEGIKTAAEAAIWGGTAGEWYDKNYHGAGDTFKNIDLGAFITNTKAIAHSIATYATSTKTIPKRAPKVVKREFSERAREHHHHSHCGHEDALL